MPAVDVDVEALTFESQIHNCFLGFYQIKSIFFLAYCLSGLHDNLLVQSQVDANLMFYLGLDTWRNITSEDEESSCLYSCLETSKVHKALSKEKIC